MRMQKKKAFEMELTPEQIAFVTKSEVVVQRQLDAYNARDLDAYLATHKSDAEQYILHGGLLAAGHEAIRKRMADRFNDPVLHARLVSRTVLGRIVVDHEFVTRTAPNGLIEIEMICIYEVYAGLIEKSTFCPGEARDKQGT
jgi:hypothetical protein